MLHAKAKIHGPAVDRNHDAKEDLTYILGYPDKTVRGERYLSRAETAAIFFRLYDGYYPNVQRQMTSKTFSDIPQGAWYYTEVELAYNIGIISGYADGTFRPDAPITRAEFAIISARFAELPNSNKQMFTDETYTSAIDLLFSELEHEGPEHIAVKTYKIFKQAAMGKTAKSIIVSAAVRLAVFNLAKVQALTEHGDLDIGSLGESKRAIFVVTPDNDDTYNFIVGMLYTQAFQALYRNADYQHGGRLPVPVRILADEFANVANLSPDDFLRVLATMRSREISISIIIQNLAQLKKQFGTEAWESVVGNTDEILYLGGNEQGTHIFLSKMLGKATIDTKTRGQTKGRQGSYTMTIQNAGRELMTPDEVRMLDNRQALLFIRGERPIQDEKYDILRHPNVGNTTDAGSAPYVHGQVTRAVGCVSCAPTKQPQSKTQSQPDTPVERSALLLLSEEDLEDLLTNEEELLHAKAQKKHC